mmetsp:Transcript_91904/g.256007  ORF Transcript_91904/g.256007 Transcript_91904/m.256007 type:complete len:351 (+) Transcript_91904:153-1205(+)
MAEQCAEDPLDGGDLPPQCLSMLPSLLAAGEDSDTRWILSVHESLNVGVTRLVEIGAHASQNTRKNMDNKHVAVAGPGAHTSQELEQQAAEGQPAMSTILGSFSLLALFDGHNGTMASAFLQSNFVSFLGAEGSDLQKRPEEALDRAFAKAEEEFLVISQKEDLVDGSTAAVVLLDTEKSRCIVANVGDTEVLLGTRGTDNSTSYEVISQLHRPLAGSAEAERVTKASGTVVKNRVAHPKFKSTVKFSLGVSRAIGNAFFKDEQYTGGKPSGVIAEPAIASVDLQPEVAGQFLIVACDGFWDAVVHKQATSFTIEKLLAGGTAQSISEDLVELARSQNSKDNITVMLAVL